MSLHRCTTPECPFVGQVTSRGCKCHKTDEQVLRAMNADLLVALREADRFLYYFANGHTSFAGGGTPLSALKMIRAAIEKAEGVDAVPPSPSSGEHSPLSYRLARVEEALRELAGAAERDLKLNQEDGDGAGGWWSLRTENAIRAARSALKDTP